MRRSNSALENLTPKISLFKVFGVGFMAWFIFCLLLGLATLGGLGYAVYWGLSLAERAVEQSEQPVSPEHQTRNHQR